MIISEIDSKCKMRFFKIINPRKCEIYFLINAQINHRFGNLKYTITKSLLINLISKISKKSCLHNY